jgi:SAM-dependent methyltransferase
MRCVRCPLCDAPPAPAFTKAGYPIARCACGMIFVAEPVPPEVLERLYDERYFAGDAAGAVPGYRDYASEEPVMRRNFARRLALIERFAAPGRLLDVGCALGFFVRVARERRWDASGVERSAYAARQAALAGLPVVHGDFLTLPIAPGRLGAVTMLDVLEHVADPRAYVRRARGLVAPGGVLAIETADLAAPLARLSGRHYHFFTPPNHLSYFTRATLARLLAEEGFPVLHTFRVGKWLTVRRLLYHLYVRAPRPLLGRLLALAERTGLAGRAVPVNLGDDMLAVACAR